MRVLRRLSPTFLFSPPFASAIGIVACMLCVFITKCGECALFPHERSLEYCECMCTDKVALWHMPTARRARHLRSPRRSRVLRCPFPTFLVPCVSAIGVVACVLCVFFTKFDDCA